MSADSKRRSRHLPATSLLVMHRGIDLIEVRRRVAELAELADDPSLIDGLSTNLLAPFTPHVERTQP